MTMVPVPGVSVRACETSNCQPYSTSVCLNGIRPVCVVLVPEARVTVAPSLFSLVSIGRVTPGMPNMLAGATLDGCVAVANGVLLLYYAADWPKMAAGPLQPIFLRPMPMRAAAATTNNVVASRNGSG